MNTKAGYRYFKYAYLLTESQFDDTCCDLAKNRQVVELISRLPGLALKSRLSVAGVLPTAWNGTCHRQGSWYRRSVKNGMYLLVTHFQLSNPDIQEQLVIMESDFRPPRIASEQDKLALVADPTFRKQLPAEWFKIPATEKKIHLKWAKRLRSNLTEFDQLFLSQTTNHRNFINPRLYIRDHDGTPILFSIDRSTHLCSCCVELFDIVGDRYSKKLVAPWPGAIICAGLEPDRYFMVTCLTNSRGFNHFLNFQYPDLLYLEN